jgi:hypothetical protein
MWIGHFSTKTSFSPITPVDFNCDHEVAVTNKIETTKSVVLFHKEQGSQEAIVGDAKNSMRPCRQLTVNGAARRDHLGFLSVF